MLLLPANLYTLNLLSLNTAKLHYKHPYTIIVHEIGLKVVSPRGENDKSAKRVDMTPQNKKRHDNTIDLVAFYKIWAFYGNHHDHKQEMVTSYLSLP